MEENKQNDGRKVILRPLSSICGREEDLVNHIVKDLPAMGNDLGFEIGGIEGEVRIEGFIADRVVKCKNGEVIVVEAQLGESNHTHIGQLLTYVATQGANRGYLVCERARQEHITALKVFGQGRLHLVEAYVIEGDQLNYRLASIQASKFRRSSSSIVSPPPYKEFWVGFKDFALSRGGMEDLRYRNPRQDIVGMDIPVGVSTIGFVFFLRSSSARITLHSGLKGKYRTDPIRELFRTGKLGNNKTLGETDKDGCGFLWIREVEGNWKNRKDWPRFYEAYVELYLRAKEESREFLEYCRKEWKGK